jgi:transmembrane sensor
MKKIKLYDTIEKFLSGNASEKEEHLLDRFYDSYENKISEIDYIKKEQIKQQIQSNIFKDIGKMQSSKKRVYPYILKLAAAIAFFIILSTGALYFLNIFGEKKHDIVWNEKITEYGQKASIDLSDGTKISLNAGSKLKYPNKFNGNPREVFLEGEAYFDVAHNPQKPFIIHTGEIYSTVLGTKLNIKAFPDEKDISISLVEGKVKVTKENLSEKQAELLLKPMQQITLNKESEEYTLCFFDLQQTTGWKDNVLIFNNISFDKVLNQLERSFGVKFELNDNSMKYIKINANFKNESLTTIVKSLAKLTKLQYKIEQNINSPAKIIFFKKQNKK